MVAFNRFLGEWIVFFVNRWSLIAPNLYFFIAEKFRQVLNSFLKFRDEQEAKLKKDSKLDLGDVTTINLTMVRGKLRERLQYRDCDF